MGFPECLSDQILLFKIKIMQQYIYITKSLYGIVLLIKYDPGVKL